MPLLGDIPLVGQLFIHLAGYFKRNLMVFIHTTVLRDDDNYSAASKRNMTRSGAPVRRVEEKKLGIVEPTDNAVLPVSLCKHWRRTVKTSAAQSV
ncbi:MAG: hypothetical protein ACLTXH_02730 [Enterobacter hormaechei]